MTLVNLTPHPIVLYGSNRPEDGPAEVIPVSGTVARVATTELGKGMSKHSHRMFERVRYGNLTGLPGRQYGTDYLVSLIVALTSKRDDLLVPYAEVRNETGSILGCRYLQRVC